MAKGGGGQGDQSEGSTGILWIIAACLIFAALIWVAFKEKIVGFYFSFKLWEIGLLSHFTDRLEDVRAYIIQTPVNQLTFQDVVHVGNAVGDYVRVPVVLLIFILAFLIYFANSTRLYKRIYTMKDLAELEKVNWPQITPILGLNLEKQNIDKGPWAMAQTPMQFCKRYKLLQEHKPTPREGMTRKEWNRIEVTLKRSQANRLFAIQLGSVWQGIHKLPMHAKALFAAFAARYHGDTKVAEKLFAQMSASSKGKIDYSGVDELLKKYEGHKRIQEIIHQHAYVLTVMASMLEAAREDGVQPAAEFLWLKAVDRKLWYMLNTVGRQTPFVEVAGPYGHWIAEKQIGRRLLVPMVEEATNALETALKEIIYNPDEV
jgi:intracellular multiplication protein IcmP